MHAIRAIVHFDTDVEFPKIKGVTDGYQPQHRFEWSDVLTSGIHHCDDAERHYAGETIEATIEFPFWSYFGDDVYRIDRPYGRIASTFDNWYTSVRCPHR